jgi:hypothetical protein
METKINLYEDKFISVLRIFFLTFWMTFFVTAWKLGFTSDFMKNWFQTWAIVFLWVFSLMCFIVSPLILNSLKLTWKKRQVLGLLILTFVFAFVFSYRFDSAILSLGSFDYIKTILINWIVLIIIVFPFGMFVAWPLAKKMAPILAKQ